MPGARDGNRAGVQMLGQAQVLLRKPLALLGLLLRGLEVPRKR